MGPSTDGDTLVEIVGRLQQRADDCDGTLTDVDREILRAIDCTMSETDAVQRSGLRRSKNAFATRQRIESILGFGASSPGKGFDVSSRF